MIVKYLRGRCKVGTSVKPEVVIRNLYHKPEVVFQMHGIMDQFRSYAGHRSNSSSAKFSASAYHIISHHSTIFVSNGIHTFTVVLAGLKIS